MVWSALTHAFLLSCTVAAGNKYYAKSYAVVVGVDEYPAAENLPDLRYAVNDANSVGDYFRMQGFEVTRLVNKEASLQRVLDALDEIAVHVERDDRVVFFFSGHGLTVERGGQQFGYLAPSDSTGKPSSMLSMGRLLDSSRAMQRAKHQLYIIDACYGGLLGTRGARFNSAHPDYMQQVTSRAARQVLTAGGADQVVLDQGADGHSVFTAALLQGLRDGLADTNGDGWIVFPELHGFLLTAAHNRYQTPGHASLAGHQLGEFVFRSPNPPAAGRQSPSPQADALAGGASRSADAMMIEDGAPEAPRPREEIDLTASGHDGNEDPSTATALPARAVVKSEVGGEGDAIDWYVMEFDQPGRISVSVRNTGSERQQKLSPLSLLSQQRSVMATTSRNGVAPNSRQQLPVVSVSPGRAYYVSLGTEPSAGAVPYEIETTFDAEHIPDTLEPNDVRADALAIQPHGGLLALVGYGTDVADHYVIDIEEDGLLRWTVTNKHPLNVQHGNLGVTRLEDSMQVEVSRMSRNGIAPGRSETSQLLSVSGGESYQIVVSPQSAAHSAPYMISTVFSPLSEKDSGEPNDARRTATPMGVEGSLTATVGFGNDREDWYVLTPEQHGLLRFTLANRTNSKVANGTLGVTTVLDDFETEIAKLNRNGIAVARRETSSLVVLERSKEYYVRILPWSGLHAGVYALETTFTPMLVDDWAEPNDTVEQAAPFDLGGAVEATVGFAGDTTDVYALRVDRAGAIKLTVRNLHPEGAAGGRLSPVRIFDAKHNVVVRTGRNGVGPGAKESTKPSRLEPGDYWLEVTPWDNDRAPYAVETLFRPE